MRASSILVLTLGLAANGKESHCHYDKRILGLTENCLLGLALPAPEPANHRLSPLTLSRAMEPKANRVTKGGTTNVVPNADQILKAITDLLAHSGLPVTTPQKRSDPDPDSKSPFRLPSAVGP
jgi:hypothetical protein